MNKKHLLAVSIATLLAGFTQSALAMQEDDSVYEWGRWSVLSPAAGSEPYRAPEETVAQFNARPGEADEFDPEVLSNPGQPPVNPPEVPEFCTPGSPCGFATYNASATVQAESVGPAAVSQPGGSGGRVLADFQLNEQQVTDPNNTGGSGPAFDTTDFAVTNADGDPAIYPDVHSVTINGAFSSGSTDIQGLESQVTGFNTQTGDVFTNAETSTLSHQQDGNGQVYDFTGADAGYWQLVSEQRVENILGGSNYVLSRADANGHFVSGTTATLDEMERFAAGHPIATYNGFVLDYASPVSLTFDFGKYSFNGNFGSANGFQGFAIDGVVNGANFQAKDSGREVRGSFFNQGFNTSGAVNNGSQLGVFSADLAGGE